MEQNEEIKNIPEDEDKSYMTKEYVRRGIHAQEKGKGKPQKLNTVIVVLVVFVAALFILLSIVKELKNKDIIGEKDIFPIEFQLENLIDF